VHPLRLETELAGITHWDGNAQLAVAADARKRAPERKVECLLQSKLAGRYGA